MAIDCVIRSLKARILLAHSFYLILESEMSIVRLFKATLLLAIFCIAGTAFFCEGGRAEVSSLIIGQNIIRPGTLLHSEGLNTPVNSTLEIAIIFGYVLAILATIVAGSRFHAEIKPILPSLNVRPVLIFLATLLLLVTPYLPGDSSHASLSVRLIIEMIESHRLALFALAVAIFLTTAGSGFYALSFMLNIFKGSK